MTETTRLSIRERIARRLEQGVQSSPKAQLNEKGQEVLDSTPMAKPPGWTEPETIVQQIHRLVREEISRQAVAEGFESFEEADDFDVDDDPEIKSAYEIDEGLPRWKDEEQKARAIELAEERLAESMERLDFLKAKVLDPKAKPSDPPSAGGSGVTPS